MEEGKKPKKKVYFGWWVVLTSFLIMGLVFAPTGTLISLFLKPISEDLGVSRTIFTTVSTIGGIAQILAALVGGRILARFNLKRVVAFSMVALAGFHVWFALSDNLVLILITSAGRGIFSTLCTTLPIAILINNWFGSRVRGKALGIAMVGSGVGSAVLSPIIGTLIDQFGWRTAYMFFAVLVVAIIPFVLATFTRQPADKGLMVFGEATAPGEKPPAVDTSGISSKNALRSSMFWVLAAALFLLSGSTQVWSYNGAAFLNDSGYDVVTTSFLMSVSSVGLIIGKVGLGALCDRFGTRTGLAISAGIFTAGYLASLFIGGGSFVVYPAVMALGLGLAIPTVATALITRDLFGNKDFGTLSGFTQSVLNLGYAIMGILSTLSFDLTGSYRLIWLVAAGMGVVGVVITYTAYGLKRGAIQKYGW
ncbi:MAG: MFS transporter [Ruminococcaceae bacterium]|nr:MFS transporter [Oscillospiraceae bacterium]